MKVALGVGIFAVGLMTKVQRLSAAEVPPMGPLNLVKASLTASDNTISVTTGKPLKITSVRARLKSDTELGAKRDSFVFKTGGQCRL